MRPTLGDAASLMTQAELTAKRAIECIAVGRLRHMNLTRGVLAELKRELRRYDISLGEWK